MKRMFKILLWLVAAVVLLLVLAAVLLPVIYDTQDLKAAIAGQVQKQTGRELSIDGPLDFSVFPWIAVEVNDLTLSNAESFGDQPFARIGKARAGLALVPLLSKQISIDEVTLDGLELSLTVNKKGQNNWDDLLAEDEAAAPEESGSPMFSSKRLAGLNISDANLEYHDQQGGSHYRLNDFSMQTGALGYGEPVPVELQASLEDVAGGTRAGLELSAVAAIDLEAERYTFDDFDLQLALEDASGSQTVSFRSPQLNLDLSAQTLQLDQFTAKLANLQADGSLSASQVIDNPAFTGALVIGEFSPLKLMDELKVDAPATSDPDVLQMASLSMNLSGSNKALKLDDFEMVLDQSRFAGEMNIRNFDQPKVSFRLAVDEIDLDRYLAPAPEEDAAGGNGAGGAGSEDVAIPQKELQGQDIEGTLSAGTLHMAGLEFSDAEVGILLRNGKLRLNPLTAGFYGGRYSGDVVLDGSTVVPVISLDEKVDGITFQRLVADLVDSEALSGMALGHVRLNGQGASSNEVLGSLQGDMGLTLTEGALEGINIWYEIRRGMALYKGQPAPEPEPKRTVFSRMQMNGSVENGVLTTRDLVGELPFLTVRGQGAVDLGRSQVDLGLVAQVRNSPDVAQDPLGSELRGKSLPFKITGSLEDPTLSVDWEALLKGEATDLLLKKLGLGEKDEASADSAEGEQDTAKSEPDLKETAKGALFDLLGGKDKDKDKDGG